jgi:hypothetical protein
VDKKCGRVGPAVVLGLIFAVTSGGADPGEPIPPPSGVVMVDPATATTDLASGASLETAPGFGTNVRVNVNQGSLARPQVEPTVTSNPTNRNHMVAGFADFVDDVFPGVSLSADGGKTWVAPSGGPVLPDPPGFQWGSRSKVGFLAGGDPAVAWGLGPTVYYATLGFQDFGNPPTPNTCNVGGLYVYRSTDSGNSWTVPSGALAVANTQTIHRDKPYIAVDAAPASPFAGNVYLVWDDDEYAGCPHSFPGNFVVRRIMFSRSTDGGSTWSPPATLATGCLVAPVPAVGADGGLYVVWYDCSTGVRQLVRKSSDGGLTFAPAVAAASGLTACPNPLPGASFRVNGAFPTIAADPLDASLVYVAWSSCTPNAQADVFFSRSTNGGVSWSSPPLRVNDDAVNNPRDQFFPWMAVDDSGVIRIMWGDDRLDLANAGGHFYDIFAAESTDRGHSFGQNSRVTTTSSDPDIDFNGTFIGDYFGLAPCGTPVWGDTRTGNQDIFGAPLDTDADGVTDSCPPQPPVCSRAGSILTVNVTGSVTIGRSGANFNVTGDGNSDPGCGEATVNNINRVNVNGTSGSQTLTINLANGSFEPGMTAEASGASEIEFDLNLRVGLDSLVVIGSSAADLYRFGTSGANLNGDDDGNDLTLARIEALVVHAGAGNDAISLEGALATGSALAIPATLNGEQGADKLTGGILDDTMKGGDGRDTCTALEIADGADTCNGGAKVDTASYAKRTGAVTLTSDGLANDGSGGENDNIATDVENLAGGEGADTITIVLTGANIGRGGRGNDTIDVRDGIDTNGDKADGGNGTDTCLADAGDTKTACEG